ncbi:MAG TPA: hypothetical protein VHP33_28655 [Polyangiaceae bacterium]|nr:hypothetical protein [Polyangiaceae bacterium]
MSLGAVVVVLIVSTAPADPAAAALELAAHELLGNSATIRVELTPRELSNNETLRRAGKADGVVELAWTDDRASALLHCYVAHDDRWVDRTITFGASDPAEERGRLLGFAIASMFPWLATPQPASPAKPLESAVAPSKDVAGKSRASGHAWQLELTGSATTGIRGPADAVGGALGLRLSLSDTWSVRAGATARVGDIAIAQASTRSGTAALGLAWATSPFDASVELGWRVDVVGTWLEVARARAADAQTERRSRLLFGGAAMLEGGYRFSPWLGLYAGAGTEALLGETDLYAEGRFVTKLPLLRIVGELGLRARF